MPIFADTLRHRLDQARARRDSQPPFSPDWDAAMSLIEELEQRLVRSNRDVHQRLRLLMPLVAG